MANILNLYCFPICVCSVAQPLVRAARDAGLRAEDGRRMLMEQAAASFRLWVGREAERDAMYAAVGLSAPGLSRPE